MQHMHECLKALLLLTPCFLEPIIQLLSQYATQNASWDDTKPAPARNHSSASITVMTTF